MKHAPKLLAPTGASMSAGASLLTGSNGRLSVVCLYRAHAETRAQRVDQAASGSQQRAPPLWWPQDVAQWRAVSSTLQAIAARHLFCTEPKHAMDKGVYDAFADHLYDATTHALEPFGACLAGVVVDVANIPTTGDSSDTRRLSLVMSTAHAVSWAPQDNADVQCDLSDTDATTMPARDVAPPTPVALAHRRVVCNTSQDAPMWLAFCRLARLRDAALWRALDVDPHVYGKRGAHMITSLLRTEEALARRRRFDPALADADDIAMLRRAFVAAADAHATRSSDCAIGPSSLS